jgi:hypothetical protein
MAGKLLLEIAGVPLKARLAANVTLYLSKRQSRR